MKSLILSMLMIFVLVGCSGDKANNAKEKVGGLLSGAIATGLDCAKPELIKEDILKLLKYEGAATEEKFVVSSLCKLAVKEVIPMVFKLGVPSRYECKLDKVEGVVDLASNACDLITI